MKIAKISKSQLKDMEKYWSNIFNNSADNYSNWEVVEEYSKILYRHDSIPEPDPKPVKPVNPRDVPEPVREVLASLF